jgi:glycosyltransferase involved in cell wall biosynthesis
VTSLTPVCTEPKLPVANTSPKGIVFQSTAYRISLASQETRAMASRLSNRGIPVQLAAEDAPDSPDLGFPEGERNDLGKLTHQKVNVAESVLYYGSVPTSWNLDYYGSRRVGRVAFWTDRIPAPWIEPCNALDEVWVPSEFNRDGFAASGVAADKLRVVPTGVDTNVFRPGLQALAIAERRKFNFLAVTDVHDRKGTELLLTAFLREFHADDDVSLTLKTLPKRDNQIDLSAALVFFIEKSLHLKLEKSACVLLLGENLPWGQMPHLYSAADALVLPARGQSCGLTLLEALACEVPVITTGWGAPLEYLNDENSYLIDSESTGQVPIGEEFLPGHCWANPSADHLQQLMRRVFAYAEEARLRAVKGRRQVAETRDWNVVLPRWEEEFRRLLS